MSNHRYNTPDEGESDWHIPLNENFEWLDADVEIRDTREGLSEYEPKSNAKFLATDTGEVFIGDGSNWNRFGTILSIYVQDTEPDNPSEGDIWIETR